MKTTRTKKAKLPDANQELVSIAPYLDVEALAQIILNSPEWSEVAETLDDTPKDKIYPTDPVEFMRDTLGYQMWPKLEEICRSVQVNHNTVVESGFGLGKCRHEDDIVYLADGSPVRAKELVDKHFQILGFDQSTWKSKSMYATAESNGVQDVYKLELQNGKVIRATGNHPLLRVDGNWTQILDLHIGDRIAIPTKLNVTYSMPKHSNDTIKLLAYLITEGYTKAKCQVTFAQAEGPVLDEWIDIVSRMGCRILKVGDYEYTGRMYFKHDGRISKGGSNPLINFSREHGLYMLGSNDKFLPTWVYNLSEQEIGLLLNRMYACDGCVYTDGAKSCISYATTSEKLAFDVSRLLLRLGIYSTIKNHQRNEDSPTRAREWCVDFSNSASIIKFFNAVGFPLGKEKQSQVCLDSARRIFNSGSEKPIPCELLPNKFSAHFKRIYKNKFQVFNNNHTKGYGVGLQKIKKYELMTGINPYKKWTDSEIGWVEIKNIEYIGKHNTVAICVPESQAFVSDVIDHNSITSSALMCWWMCTHDPAMVITVAPTFNQVQGIIWQNARSAAKRAELPGTILETPKWKITEERIAYGISPRRSNEIDLAAMQGRHSPNLLVIMDEAAGLPRALWDTAQGLVVGNDNRLLCLGNPIEQSGPFWDATNHSNWNSIRISCLDHPNVISGQELIPGAVTRAWVDDRCKDWATECSPDTPEAVYIPWQNRYYKPLPIFMAKVLGIAPEQAEDQLIKLSWVLDAQQRVIDVSKEQTVVGVDPAPRGGDDNVLCTRTGNKIYPIKRMKGQDTQVLAEWLALEMHQTGAVKGYIDDIGVGTGVTDKARRMGLPVMAVNFSSRATQRKRFANLRAECYWTVRELLREGKMSLPNDPMLVADLTAPKYAPDPYGRILIESKDDIRARLGRSPDAGDGVALSYAVPITEASEELENQQRALIQESSWGGSKWLINTPNSRHSRWRK